MMNSPTENKKVGVGESSVDEFKSPPIGNLEKSLASIDEYCAKQDGESPGKDLDKDLVSMSSASVSKRLSERLAGRVSKFNANPTDGSFLSPMQSSLKKKMRNNTLAPPIEFSPEPRRLHQSKKLETKIKAYSGNSSKSDFVKIDLRSPEDVKKLVTSRDNQRLGQILSQYEKLAKRTPQQRYELDSKMAARERHRSHGSKTISEEERAELLRQSRARLYRSGSERILEESSHSHNTGGGDDTVVCGNVWAVQCDFTDFVSPYFEKTETQRNLILGVIERSFVFAEFRKHGKARCEGAVDMLVDAFESVSFPSGHTLVYEGDRKSVV